MMMRYKTSGMIVCICSASMVGSAQTIQTKIDSLKKDPATVERAAKADVYSTHKIIIAPQAESLPIASAKNKSTEKNVVKKSVTDKKKKKRRLTVLKKSCIIYSEVQAGKNIRIK